jgi:hypothetical protein
VEAAEGRFHSVQGLYLYPFLHKSSLMYLYII